MDAVAVKKDLRTPKLLIVDDELGIREPLKEFLASAMSIEAYAAKNSEEALEMIKNGYFDVMITDINLGSGQMTGIELIREIKKLRFPPAPIVMTGFRNREYIAGTVQIGAYDFIEKPFNFKEIIPIIENVLKRKKVEDENIRLKQINSIYKIAEQIESVRNVDEVFGLMLEAGINEIGGDIAIVALFNDNTKSCEYRTGLTRKDELNPKDVFDNLNTKIIKEHLKNEKQIMVSDEYVNNFMNGDNLHKITFALILPIRIKNVNKGFFAFFLTNKEAFFTEGDRKASFVLVSRVSGWLTNLKLIEDLENSFTETIRGLIIALESKDIYTKGHSLRVSYWAKLIVSLYPELDEDEIDKINKGAMLHDIGKIGMKIDALTKSEPLTPEEVVEFNNHPSIGAQILQPISFLKDVSRYVLYHHERCDGKGYPNGLKCEEIPLGARIISLADSFDVMVTDRPYRKSLPFEKVIIELIENAGTQFDKDITLKFLRFLAENDLKRIFYDNNDDITLKNYYKFNKEFMDNFDTNVLKDYLEKYSRKV